MRGVCKALAVWAAGILILAMLLAGCTSNGNTEGIKNQGLTIGEHVAEYSEGLDKTIYDTCVAVMLEYFDVLGLEKSASYFDKEFEDCDAEMKTTVEQIVGILFEGDISERKVIRATEYLKDAAPKIFGIFYYNSENELTCDFTAENVTLIQDFYGAFTDLVPMEVCAKVISRCGKTFLDYQKMALAEKREEAGGQLKLFAWSIGLSENEALEMLAEYNAIQDDWSSVDALEYIKYNSPSYLKNKDAFDSKYLFYGALQTAVEGGELTEAEANEIANLGLSELDRLIEKKDKIDKETSDLFATLPEESVGKQKELIEHFYDVNNANNRIIRIDFYEGLLENHDFVEEYLPFFADIMISALSEKDEGGTFEDSLIQISDTSSLGAFLPIIKNLLNAVTDDDIVKIVQFILDNHTGIVEAYNSELLLVVDGMINELINDSTTLAAKSTAIAIKNTLFDFVKNTDGNVFTTIADGFSCEKVYVEKYSVCEFIYAQNESDGKYYMMVFEEPIKSDSISLTASYGTQAIIQNSVAVFDSERALKQYARTNNLSQKRWVAGYYEYLDAGGNVITELEYEKQYAIALQNFYKNIIPTLEANTSDLDDLILPALIPVNDIYKSLVCIYAPKSRTVSISVLIDDLKTYCNLSFDGLSTEEVTSLSTGIVNTIRGFTKNYLYFL